MLHRIKRVAAGAGTELLVDFTSDYLARERRVQIHRDAVLQADDVLRHVTHLLRPVRVKHHGEGVLPEARVAGAGIPRAPVLHATRVAR